MLKKRYIKVTPDIKIRLYKIILAIIFGCVCGVFAHNVAVKGSSYESSPKLTKVIVFFFTVVGTVGGALIPLVKYKTNPKDKDKSGKP